MSEFKYKQSLRPKEYHPMVPYCQEVFVAAGAEYINYLMEQLRTIIEHEAGDTEDGTPAEENLNGVVYDTFRRIMTGENLNDRYLMGATLFLIHSLIPVNEVIEKRVEELKESQQESEE